MPEPLTVRSIIYLLGKIWRASTKLSNAEQAFLANFAAATDRGSFIEDEFFSAAVEGGKTLETYTYPMPDEDEDAGWVGLHRFFGMYVVHHTQYGEGQDDYGPFTKQKDADAAFSAVVTLCT